MKHLGTDPGSAVPKKKRVGFSLDVFLTVVYYIATQSMVLARRGKKREEERVFNSCTTFRRKIRSGPSAGEAWSVSRTVGLPSPR